MIDPERPVALRHRPGQTGKIIGKAVADRVYVRWDAGGANSVEVSELVQEGADKAWPPDNFETKAPTGR